MSFSTQSQSPRFKEITLARAPSHARGVKREKTLTFGAITAIHLLAKPSNKYDYTSNTNKESVCIVTFGMYKQQQTSASAEDDEVCAGALLLCWWATFTLILKDNALLYHPLCRFITCKRDASCRWTSGKRRGPVMERSVSNCLPGGFLVGLDFRLRCRAAICGASCL